MSGSAHQAIGSFHYTLESGLQPQASTSFGQPPVLYNLGLSDVFDSKFHVDM